MSFECEKCGGPTNVMVQMTVCAPSEMMHNFSKKNMRSKEFRISGVSWETADFICKNPKCGHVTNGYGNYVSNLKKENERLKAERKVVVPYDLYGRSWPDAVANEVNSLLDRIIDLETEEHEAFCLYCGKSILYRKEEGVEVVHDRMVEHDITCAKNPLVKRIRQLEEALEDISRHFLEREKIKLF